LNAQIRKKLQMRRWLISASALAFSQRQHRKTRTRISDILARMCAQEFTQELK
jgi:hypothetical protein